MTPIVPRKQLSPAWILAILTGLNLFNYLDRFVLSAVLTPLQKDLAINDGQAGRLVTAFMIGYFVTSPVFGWLGDRWSRKCSSPPAFLSGAWAPS
jgi:MFS family permease